MQFKMIKKNLLLIALFVLLLIVIITLYVVAPENGLSYIEMSILSKPSKTTYIAGEDTYLDFSGGIIQLKTVSGETTLYPIESFNAIEWRQNGFPKLGKYNYRFIASDILFDIPGEYTVTIYQTKRLYVSYSVTVE